MSSFLEKKSGVHYLEGLPERAVAQQPQVLSIKCYSLCTPFRTCSDSDSEADVSYVQVKEEQESTSSDASDDDPQSAEKPSCVKRLVLLIKVGVIPPTCTMTGQSD